MNAILTVALVLTLAAPTSGEGTKEWLDHFELYHECTPMGILIEGLSQDAKDIGLTKESLHLALESRLRAARLYAMGRPPYLYLNVHVVGAAFSVRMEFTRWLCYADDPSQCGGARTWETGSAGTHGKSSGFLLQSVAEHMDRFLAAYLRVNEAACNAKD